MNDEDSKDSYDGSVVRGADGLRDAAGDVTVGDVRGADSAWPYHHQ